MKKQLEVWVTSADAALSGTSAWAGEAGKLLDTEQVAEL